MFYYTAEYKAAVRPTSVQTYVNAIVAKINEGYFRSGLNMRAKAFCVRQSRISESSGNPSTIIRAFRDSESL